MLDSRGESTFGTQRVPIRYLTNHSRIEEEKKRKKKDKSLRSRTNILFKVHLTYGIHGTTLRSLQCGQLWGGNSPGGEYKFIVVLDLLGEIRGGFLRR